LLTLPCVTYTKTLEASAEMRYIDMSTCFIMQPAGSGLAGRGRSHRDRKQQRDAVTKERHGLMAIEASGLPASKADRVSPVPSVPAFGHLLSCKQSGFGAQPTLLECTPSVTILHPGEPSCPHSAMPMRNGPRGHESWPSSRVWCFCLTVPLTPSWLAWSVHGPNAALMALTA
jgi:hypothetical protein